MSVVLFHLDSFTVENHSMIEHASTHSELTFQFVVNRNWKLKKHVNANPFTRMMRAVPFCVNHALLLIALCFRKNCWHCSSLMSMTSAGDCAAHLQILLACSQQWKQKQTPCLSIYLPFTIVLQFVQSGLWMYITWHAWCKIHLQAVANMHVRATTYVNSCCNNVILVWQLSATRFHDRCIVCYQRGHACANWKFALYNDMESHAICCLHVGVCDVLPLQVLLALLEFDANAAC